MTSERTTVTVLHGDCIGLMAEMQDCSVDAIVTDPPYELRTIGKQWDDGSGIAYSIPMWTEALRVLKPGGHLLAFGGTRTYHRMACAIEDAGFEIRDSLHWIYGSGFPKSLNISKAIDKAAGAERKPVREYDVPKGHAFSGPVYGNGNDTTRAYVTEAATPEAAQWEGWGTALKPAHEPIVLARKLLEGTVAATVLKHGTGGLNIDGCRVDGPARDENDTGRWPQNIIIDTAAAQEMDRQRDKSARLFKQVEWHDDIDGWPFIYQAKPTTKERNAGLEGLPERRKVTYQGAAREGKLDPLSEQFRTDPMANHHPTVKPIALMRHLVRLVTPPGGIVLDPFAGSGTTLAAAVLEGFNAVGCELTDDFLPIIRGRVEWAHGQVEADAQGPKQERLI